MRFALPTLAALLLLSASAEAAKPDVRAVRVAAPAFAHPGGELSVQLTATAKRHKVRRTGVRVYLSADRKRGKGDVRVGARRLPPIKRGKRRTIAVGARVPAGTAAGARYVIACADDPGRIRERSERNNCRAAKVAITAAADPAKTTAALIEADRAAGKLSDERALLYRAYAVMGDQRLPARYRGDASAEEDDGALRELANAWPGFSKATKRAFGQRPAKRGARASAEEEFDERGPCATDEFVTPWQWKNATAAGGKVRVHWPEDTPKYGKDIAQVTKDVSHAYARFKAIMGREPLSDGKSHCAHGPDGALDIYLTDVAGAAGYTLPSELRKYTSPECKGFPSFIVADGEPDETFTTRFTLAHELFHAFQNAFPYKAACSEYRNFDEASANWAAHAAFPDDDGEHFFTYMQDDAFDAVDEEGYHGWLFPLWMEKTFGDASIRGTYQQFRTKGRAAAIDAAIGGFRPHLLDFVKHGWNQAPFATFTEWDRFDRPAMKGSEPIPETHLFLVGEPTRTAYPKAEVPARGREYKRYRITDEKVREIAFRNPLAGNPDFRVGAILTFADGSTRFDDWSGKDRVAYCRDNPGENVVSLVIAYGNARLDDAWISGTPELGLRDRCDGYPWHFKILNASLETRADGGMNAGGDHECDDLPIHGETKFMVATADNDFSREHDVARDGSGALEGELATSGDAGFFYTLSGCQGSSPKTPCSTVFERGGGKRNLSFTFEAASPKAATAKLTWAIPNPSIGFVDYDDSVCNVQDIWHGLAPTKPEQEVPLAWFAGTTPFLLEFKGDDQFGEDQWGRPATLHYDWTYRMTIQRVDEQGNPL
jgi:hypothetical protein